VVLYALYVHCTYVQLSYVSEDIPIRVVGLRRCVTLCKIAPYRNSLTYLLTYLCNKRLLTYLLTMYNCIVYFLR